MISLTLAQVAAVTGGVLNGGADPDAIVTGPVEFDSRLVSGGGLFLAVAGEHVDGHDFAAAAIAAGAVAVMGSRALDVPCIVVAEPLAAIAALASQVAARLTATVIAVTGSSGKTTAKDLIAAVLRPAGPTIAPRGSFNNELGYPYTVLQADLSTRFLVLEASARGLDHIRALTSIAAPRIGVVLNVGSAHLGEFGDRATIARAKGELIEALPTAADGGIAILNADDPVVATMVPRTTAKIVWFGESERADVRADDIEIDRFGRASFTLHSGGEQASVAMRLVGEHQVSNALAAAAVGLACGLQIDDIAVALAGAQAASRWRMELHERADGVVVINDAYNANPESMRAALKTLAQIGRAGRRTWAVLGPMAELGPASMAEHDTIGRLAVRLDIHLLIAVGEQARPIAQGAGLEGSWNGEARWVPDIATALELLEQELESNDVVLVKASRSAGLERLAIALERSAVAATFAPSSATSGGLR
jgi:UDP-N-acetylmuramoyl-tripeptide--D-alanyl-D-alanine ligase